jgi:AcrR family transcriptional regulator
MAKDSAEETRERILNQSVSLFAQSGFDGVSMRNVAAGTDLTTAALYYHFPDKEQLYLSCIEHSFQNRITPLLLHSDATHSSWQKLEQFIHRFSNLLAEDRDFQRLLQWVTLDTDDQRSEKLTNTVFAPFFNLVSDIIGDIQLHPQATHFSTVAIISLLVFPFETSHARRLLPGYQSPHKAPQQLASQIIQLLRNGLDLS